MADRYCRNCGNELGTGDRFCQNCGTPVHQAAYVPTPEADVPVPPPPQQQAGGPPLRHLRSRERERHLRDVGEGELSSWDASPSSDCCSSSLRQQWLDTRRISLMPALEGGACA